jgi:Ca2+-binding RTX toxin-like protein
MPAYAFDTATTLTTQLQTDAHIDAVTAAQITNFLSLQGKFPTPSSTVKVEGPTTGATPDGPLYFTGLDPTTGVDVYEINGTENYDYSTGQPTGTILTGFLELNATGDTLPTGSAIVMANNSADTINVDDNVSGNYLIATGAGDDFINMHGSTGSDTILTGAGNDSIILGAGQTTVYTGTGNDSVAAFAPGMNTIYGYSSLPSDGGNDQFYLSGGTNILHTSDGNNTITAIGGSNTLYLGSGNDLIVGGVGTSSPALNSVYNLGSGNDTVTTTNETGTINGGIGQDSILLETGGYWTVNLDTAPAAAQAYVPGQNPTYNDVIDADSGTNIITGGAANTQFNIGGGANSISGGSGTDQFNDNSTGGQTLVGGSHFDLFNINGVGGSQTGTDTITGGTGALYTNVNLTSGSVSIDGSASSSNTVDFTQFSASQVTHPTGSDTYTFGSGLSVTILDANNAHTTVIFGH